MRNKILLTIAALASLGLAACGGGATPTTATANKSGGNAATNSAPAANKPAANTTAPKPASEPKTELKNESKPNVESKKTEAKVPAPANWIYLADEGKGYGFKVPEGTKGDSATSDGVDTFLAETPEGIGVIVFAWKDASLTKEDLLNRAEAAMAAFGEKLTAGKLTGESEDYAVAEANSVNNAGKKSRMMILVGTDVTDKYVMIVGTEEDKYAARKETIDAIWGSFEMYSGGASGAN